MAIHSIFVEIKENNGLIRLWKARNLQISTFSPINVFWAAAPIGQCPKTFWFCPWRMYIRQVGMGSGGNDIRCQWVQRPMGLWADGVRGVWGIAFNRNSRDTFSTFFWVFSPHPSRFPIISEHWFQMNMNVTDVVIRPEASRDLHSNICVNLQMNFKCLMIFFQKISFLSPKF